jgi:trehalose 6-phosphate phosphatase
MRNPNLTPDGAPAPVGSRLPLPASPVVLQRPALFIDLDGVLAPLAEIPEAVVPDGRRTVLLIRPPGSTAPVPRWTGSRSVI